MANSGLIFYIGKLIYPKYDPVWFVGFMYFKYLSIVKRSQTYFIKSLSDKIMWNLIRTIPWSNCDINNCVIVNHEQIYPSDKILELYINNDYYYKIKSRNVVVIPNEYCDKNVVFISNTLYSNYIKNYNKNGNIEQVKLHKKIQSKLDFAQEIELARINTPIDINNATIDHLIKSYFKKPKLIYQNDIITINVKDFDEPLFYSNVKFEMVYFKCLKVRYKDREIIGGLYCAIGETSIKQCPNIQSFIPKISEIAPCKRNQMYMENFVNISMCPYGLKNYFNSLYESVTPFLEMNDELEDLFPVFLVQGAEGSGADILINALAQKLGMHHFKIHNSDLNANVYSQNESKLVNVFFRAKLSSPCIISIDKFENFGKNNEGQYDARLISSFAQELEKLFFENNNNQFPIILFCCSCTNSNKEQIPADLKRLFLEIIEINAPNDTERVQLLKWIIERNNLKSDDDINLENIANKTHGFYFEDLKALIYYAELNSAKRDEENMDIFLNDVDFEDAIDFMQSNYNQSLGAPKVPKIKWSDVGGLNEVKSEIIKTINLPLQHPELFEKSGLSRSGILLFGPPGTGKTLLAKAVATECNLCFLTVKGPELLNMYVGQSERNVREVFEKARQASPCIIFFDELDSLAPNRGLSGDSGGVMDRVVSQLLAEMDGIDGSASGKIFIIGATNRPDLIDPALLRPGRFDKLLFVGPCSDAESKSSVLEALTKKFRFSEEINLRSIAEKCPKYITGADFYGICSSAWFSAAKRLIERIEQEAGNPEEYSEADVEVAEIDFLEALQNVKPSINEEDMRHFENLRNNFNK